MNEHRRSIRTPETPAAFALSEVVIGAAIAYGAFAVTYAVWLFITLLIDSGGSIEDSAIGYSIGFWTTGMQVAVIAVPLGAITAGLLGHVMRRRPNLTLHLIVHGVHGFLWGTLATLVAFAGFGILSGDPSAVWSAMRLGAGPAAVAAMVGWSGAVLIARRMDRRAAAPPIGDVQGE